MLDLTDISKTFQKGTSSEQKVLVNCFLSVKEGDRIVIGGENGSGKTTLLRIIGLLDKEYEGEYRINNKAVSKMSPTHIATLRNEMFGFIFQDYNLLEDENAYDNIIIPLLYSKKYEKKERAKRIHEISEILEITSILKRKVNVMSGGERQKVAIARALVNDPQVLVFDEPTSALNPRMKLKTLNYIESILDKKKALVFVSHDRTLSENANYICYQMADGLLKKYE